ncbi:MAG: hypothetical protein D084_Lepto4C00439G0002 [Leptospirillum sp. Group IV 'UBA BS']|nr:MAG: hypothetical protein D084_Lepto4C00439G0002 [Leptospirillum sp. Group IV 'UBA BS']
MNQTQPFFVKLVLYLGVEFLLIQGGMTLNLYGSRHNIGGLEMISWFAITGSLAVAVGFGALLSEARPDPVPGHDQGLLLRLAPQIPWIFALGLMYGESFFYFPKF